MWGFFWCAFILWEVVREERGYVFFAVVASSLLACTFPVSLLLLQHYVGSGASPFEVGTNFCGAVWECSAACTEILMLQVESTVTGKPCLRG